MSFHHWTGAEAEAVIELWQSTELHVREMVSKLSESLGKLVRRRDLITKVWALADDKKIIVTDADKENRLAWGKDEPMEQETKEK